MILAMAEMYVQGVSTRKVTAVVQELCGLEVTSTQVSRALLRANPIAQGRNGRVASYPSNSSRSASAVSWRTSRASCGWGSIADK